MSSLLVRSIKKKFGSFELNADFEVGAGERAVVLSRSGAGKTTLLRILAGLEPLRVDGTEGRVFLGDQELTHLEPAQRNIGWIAQEPALFESLNLLENAAFGLRIRKIRSDDINQELNSWLKKLGLWEMRHHRITQLSGGEKQRLAFLRAVIWKPSLLLMDEPFSALDSDLRAQLRAELLGFLEQNPIPLVFVTHDEEEAAAIGTSQITLIEDTPQRRKFMKAPNSQR